MNAPLSYALREFCDALAEYDRVKAELRCALEDTIALQNEARTAKQRLRVAEKLLLDVAENQ